MYPPNSSGPPTPPGGSPYLHPLGSPSNDYPGAKHKPLDTSPLRLSGYELKRHTEIEEEIEESSEEGETNDLSPQLEIQPIRQSPTQTQTIAVAPTFSGQDDFLQQNAQGTFVEETSGTQEGDTISCSFERHDEESISSISSDVGRSLKRKLSSTSYRSDTVNATTGLRSSHSTITSVVHSEILQGDPAQSFETGESDSSSPSSSASSPNSSDAPDGAEEKVSPRKRPRMWSGPNGFNAHESLRAVIKRGVSDLTESRDKKKRKSPGSKRGSVITTVKSRMSDEITLLDIPTYESGSTSEHIMKIQDDYVNDFRDEKFNMDAKTRETRLENKKCKSPTL